MNAQAFGKPSAFSYLAFLLAVSLGSARANMAISVLGAWVDGSDTAFCGGLARDMGQVLAEDTALLVYDLRKKHGAMLDSARERGALREPAVLAALNGRQIKWGLVVECAETEGGYRCRLEALDLATARGMPVDTLLILSEAKEKRRLFGQAVAAPFLSRFAPKRELPSLGGLALKTPVNPGMVVRGVSILRKGIVTEVPLGATLVIGDAPRPFLVSLENTDYVLYPNSSYTYLLPKVVQLNQGFLGVLGSVDSATGGGKGRQASTDPSNLIWRTLAKVAAMDSSNLLWKGLGKAASLDSQNLILQGLRKAAAMDSGNPIYQALGKVTALDSSNVLLRTLSRIAVMDSGNLVWKGLGQVSELDSANPIWRKLGEIASLDSNSVWRKLGLLAFQDNSVVLTPSCIARGRPQAVLFRHEGSVTTIEVVKGSLSVQPFLSSQKEGQVGAMRVAHTRGYALKQERLPSSRADRILRDFQSVNAGRGSRTFARFLPGKLFSAGTALRTADRPVQAFMAAGFRELDMEMDVLSSEKEGFGEFGGTFRSGSEESGCYLCSPYRLGP